ncbi:MAG TPA: 2-hydroxypenta-2,4-dienoate hydratase [Chloroflexus aurantiacus]|jgi:2-keto-4-pentenoate hydratase|uniref:4-oxalocrotonate decarboxylase n=1 Tax=Chloroflexus aurantiacus (strain ATCC 29366 / DSM 635 / J-10-fl) TaxID=324602 RepID=A9W9U9_CHLAA|nr:MULTISPECIES: fumarylacetoacetate hydrolase family protein [Chloroflexus]ABY34585.1 4-oxalocrotonate decarboxylase [Chloroflexus aurantiacus J-10-fl]RMG46802.1 MAG: 2-hydroxypenta-2,4-dienoate hydratase [Chloroflexota bacterium]GIV93916.1 MAG: 2-hydroxypenta-2,4-dienoate hydratase [Chloroflexus sp.]HBW66832.1 2-hydroxypenta-2,4-dienoate hydratase [Chloroflexus aurantiacus]
MPEQSVTTQTTDDALIIALAQRLDQAWEERFTILPLTESEGITNADIAYRIQTHWTDMRVQRGERIIGRKIGLTSKAVQEQMGVNEPDYGTLWASRYFPARNGRAEAPFEIFLQPRVEGEIAFLIGETLDWPDITPQQVLAATEALAAAIEIVDSRIDRWRIKLADTIADNASYGGLTIGAWSRAMRSSDLRTIGMVMSHNGRPTVFGTGAAALGHPALAVAWLANKLRAFGIPLRAGDIVISGALAATIPVQRGDLFTLEMHDQPPLHLRFV